jgi:hypothetical protein
MAVFNLGSVEPCRPVQAVPTLNLMRKLKVSYDEGVLGVNSNKIYYVLSYLI